MPTDPLPDWVLTHRQEIGDRIRAERERQQVTQERLAEQAGLDRKTVNRIEQGTYSTRIDHMILIARALGVPLRDLM